MEFYRKPNVNYEHGKGLKIPKNRRAIAILSAAVLFLTYLPLQAQAMGFLDFARIYIFSEVDGVVTIDGIPVKGAEVVRTADFRDKIHTHTAITDDQGRFHFDDIYTYSLRLSETAILQKIVIHHQSEEYLAWKLLKRHDNRYGELTDPETPGKPVLKLNLKCELTGDQEKEERIKFVLGDRIIYGLARWD